MRTRLSYLFAQSSQQSLSAQYFLLYYLVFDLSLFFLTERKEEKKGTYTTTLSATPRAF